MAWPSATYRTAAIICSALIATQIASATALPSSAEECLDLRWTHSVARQGKDLGAGVTSHVFYSGGHSAGGSSLVVQHCGSGYRVSVRLTAWVNASLFDEQREPTTEVVTQEDNSSEVMSVFDGVATLGSPFDFELFQRTLDEMGIEFVVSANEDLETCECAVAYPLMQGEKSPYRPNEGL